MQICSQRARRRAKLINLTLIDFKVSEHSLYFGFTSVRHGRNLPTRATILPTVPSLLYRALLLHDMFLEPMLFVQVTFSKQKM